MGLDGGSVPLPHRWLQSRGHMRPACHHLCHHKHGDKLFLNDFFLPATLRPLRRGAPSSPLGLRVAMRTHKPVTPAPTAREAQALGCART